MKSPLRAHVRLTTAAVAAIGLASSFGLGQSATFNKPGGGNWSDPSAWTPSGPPTSGDAVLLPFSNPPGPNPVIVINYDLPMITTLDELGSVGTPSDLTLNIPQGGIVANIIHIGAAVSQGGHTTYNLGNAVLTAQHTLTLGANAAGGTLNQSAGMLTAGTMNIGLSNRNGPQIPSGYTLSAGIATIGTLNLGSAQTEGTLNLSGGALTVTNVANLGTTSDFRGGETSFINLTGGSMHVQGSEFIGNINSSAHLTISGNAQHVVDDLLWIARGAAGNLQFFSASNSGSVRVLGGTLTAGSIEMGDNTVGTFSTLANSGTLQIAGGVTTTSLLRIGKFNTSTMTVSVSGGVLDVNGPILLSAKSTFTVSGGRVEADRVAMDSGIVEQGTITLSGGQLQLTGADESLLRAGNFTIAGGPGAWTGTLDVDRSPVSLRYTTAVPPLETVRDQLESGFAGGAWTGTGIRSSAAAADSRTAVGYDADFEQVRLRYTLFGDANLDFTVNISDFSILAANFNQGGYWFEGDFNYDNIVNLGDFALLAGNFNQTLAPSRLAVPEPLTLSMAGALLLFAWRTDRTRRSTARRQTVAGKLAIG